ncbi:hypothetical protein EW146_g7829 [Bondarzewia mesenterica]|uniref:Uncharacterized protein n=1 Tax=Bondarzewia mesenterica TaxID=1095465 RepID=A0A4S4LPM3_9AGAM|nr:hypothetical protein EW146_g7829 [Bondarzewia mesenterica]
MLGIAVAHTHACEYYGPILCFHSSKRRTALLTKALYRVSTYKGLTRQLRHLQLNPSLALIMSSVGELLNGEKQDDVISLSGLGASQVGLKIRMSAALLGLLSSLTSLIPPSGSSTPVKGARLEVKKLDKLNVPGSRKWQLFDTAQYPPPSKEELEEGRYSGYAGYVLILRRKVVLSRNSDIPIYVTKLIVWSEPLRKAIGDVLKGVRKISWNAVPFKFDPRLLLAFLPQHLLWPAV